MERRQLEYFLAVVEHGGFTAAASALFVAQPSVSYAVRTLERELGTLLVDRLPSGIRLTAAGSALLEPARQALRAMETAKAHVADVLGAVRGDLDLVCLPATVADPVGPALAAFRQDHQGVRVRIAHAVDAADAMTALRHGRAELGVTDAAPGGDVQLEAVPLGRQDVVLSLPPGSPLPSGPLPIEALAAVPLIATHAGGPVMTDLAGRAARAGRRLRVAVEVENRESAMHLVLAGVAAALLPVTLAGMAAGQGAVTVPLDPPVSRELFLLRRRQTTLSPAAARFQEVLLDRFPSR